jgi:hypothetical protein
VLRDRSAAVEAENMVCIRGSDVPFFLRPVRGCSLPIGEICAYGAATGDVMDLPYLYKLREKS